MITGAGAGLGRAITHLYAKNTWSIGLISRDRERLEETRREVRSLGGQAEAYPLDVADAAAVEGAAEALEKKFGPIDVWVNNAMVSVFSPVTEMKPEEYQRVTNVTYLGYVYGTLAALKRMVPRDKGVVAQVGSALAYRGIPLQSAYCGAKHAIQGFTESLRCELMHEKSKVGVIMVQMPAMNTPQFEWTRSRMPCKPQPVPPIYQPEVGARAVYFAAQHPERRELFVGSSTIVAIDGDKVAPGVGDWFLAKTGYESQMIDEPADPDRPDNLWRPVPGNFGAHGPFNDRAHARSPQLWIDTHRRMVALAGTALLGAGWAWSATRRGGLPADA